MRTSRVADSLPCLLQDVTPPDPVVQCMESAPPALLGGHEKLPLELAHFVYGVVGTHRPMPSYVPPTLSMTKAGPLPSNDVLVAALIGTMSPSDSLPTPVHFTLGL